MAKQNPYISAANSSDDNYLFVVRRDLSKGMNQRTHKTQLEDTEVERFENQDLGVIGNRTKRPGLTLLNQVYMDFAPDAYTKLLLHMDGANASTTFTDSSSRANTVTAAGDAQLSTSVKKFGTASAKFDGTGDYLTVPSDQKLTNGSLETWSGGASAAPDGWTLSGAGAAVAREGTTIKVGTYSAKLTRSGTDASMEQDVATALGGLPASIGKSVTMGCWIWASVANRAKIRIGQGSGVGTDSAYHTGDSTWQYLTVTHTVLAGASKVGATVQVVTGDTTAYFDGAFVTDDSVANFNFGSGDWTIDTWAYFTDVTTATGRILFGQSLNTGGQRSFYLNWQQTTGLLGFYCYEDGVTGISKSDAWTPSINTWYHVEVCRYGNYIHVFINGVELGTPLDVTGKILLHSETVFSIGCINTQSTPSNLFIGYLDELRVSKGIARHTANFTPPIRAYEYSLSTNPICGLFNFEPVGSSSKLLIQDSTYLRSWDGQTPVVITDLKTDFTAASSKQPTMLKAYESGTGDVVLVKVENNNWFRFKQDGSYEDLGSTGTNYQFTVTAPSVWPTVGAVYTNNGHSYTIINTSTTGLFVTASGNGTPTATGTLTKSTGTGDATLTFSAVVSGNPPPASNVACIYGNKMLVLKNNLLYFSSTAPSDYSNAFDTTTGAYRINVGDERVVLPTRDYGVIVGGSQAIYTLAFASSVPAATDIPQQWLNIGIAEGNTFAQVADDYLFLSYDGVRGVKRTVYDKLQTGQSLPLSYRLKDEFEEINWSVINKACAIYFDNKYFLSLPTGSSQTNNTVWVYWPALDAWSVITGWNVSCWAEYKVDGKPTLFAGEATNEGIVYKAWKGTSDNGTAITSLEWGKNEDMGQPLVRKVNGEIKVIAQSTGDYNLNVFASFDDGGFNLLGTMNLSGAGLTFPLTFPVYFALSGNSYKKFHMDGYNPWYYCQLQITNSDIASHEGDITVLETDITALPEQYISEEEI